MIYCVVPKALEDELYPKLLAHYEQDENVTVIVERREADRRGRRWSRSLRRTASAASCATAAARGLRGICSRSLSPEPRGLLLRRPAAEELVGPAPPYRPKQSRYFEP